ncbi:hypothetical protein [Novacetimonas pomaceti]|uniref:hypothetical protein n=1 Tax=Novacetimonas pomaceti TaxID=2021998 RepID=UPI001C2CC770|nr:hypothetical protein [Novacetimonas pomaceti]MBV1834601.1 hypothetical protein [Novacetimonas pomaceti]
MPASTLSIRKTGDMQPAGNGFRVPDFSNGRLPENVFFKYPFRNASVATEAGHLKRQVWQHAGIMKGFWRARIMSRLAETGTCRQPPQRHPPFTARPIPAVR